MVLIGDTDYEFKEATKRGMHAIGIDIRKESVGMFRKSGGIAIQDDFRQQMCAIKPEAVIFDGVSGLTAYTEYLSEYASLCNVKAFVWNGLRGRDSHSGEWKRRFSGETIDVYSKGRFVAKRQPGIHRAMLLYAKSHLRDMRNLEYVVRILINSIPQSSKREMLWIASRLQVEGVWELARQVVMEMIRLRHKQLDLLLSNQEWAQREFAIVTNFEDIFQGAVSRVNRPEFMTYKSKDSGQYFDTGAWTPLPGSEIDIKVERKSKLKAAAAKALLTMQKHGRRTKTTKEKNG
jgi:hypothetical protein